MGNTLSGFFAAGRCSKSRQAKRAHRPAARARLEALESRLLMHGEPLLPDHYVFDLAIQLQGQNVALPANIGVTAGNVNTLVHTDDANGLVHAQPFGGQTTLPHNPTLGEFFDVWRTNAGDAGNNANAIFNENQILDRQADADHVIVMYVNGVPNFQFDGYVPLDGDQIVISYDATPVRHQPALVPIDTQTMLAGQSMHVPLDGTDHEDQPLRYTVTSSNPNVSAQLLNDNPGLRLNVRIGGATVVLPDFSRPDLNPNSATLGQNVGPSFYSGKVSAYYFANPG
jgi:hypothetical protein